jgi:hypothetical protein
MVEDKRLGAVEELVGDALRERGSVLFTITSASMEPAIRVGDQVEVRRLGPGSPSVGDIVLFRDARLGMVVHRVLWRWGPLGRPARVYTKGDAVPRRDPPLRGEDIMGRVERILRRGEEVPGATAWRRMLALRSTAALVFHRLLGSSRVGRARLIRSARNPSMCDTDARPEP